MLLLSPAPKARKMTRRDVEILSAVPLFSCMNQDDIQRLADRAVHQNYKRGEVIIYEGERDHRLFVLVTGSVEIIKNFGERTRHVLGTLHPPAYFGEMALVDDLLRSASVVASEPAEVISIDRLNLREEIKKYPDLALELMRALSRRVRTIEKTFLNAIGTFLPICASCKRVREDTGMWTEIEDYISKRSGTAFSHTICPDCAKRLYPDFYEGVGIGEEPEA